VVCVSTVLEDNARVNFLLHAHSIAVWPKRTILPADCCAPKRISA
jgi:hypothetical protein